MVSATGPLSYQQGPRKRAEKGTRCAALVWVQTLRLCSEKHRIEHRGHTEVLSPTDLATKHGA